MIETKQKAFAPERRQKKDPTECRAGEVGGRPLEDGEDQRLEA